MDQRTCSLPDCSNRHQARGLCSTHYNHKFQPDRHPNSIEQSRARRQRDKLNPALVAKERARSNAKAAAHRLQSLTGWRVLATEPPRQLDAEMDAVDKWRYLACPWCGESFWSRHASAIYCGRPCHDRASRARRRALECGAIGTYTWAEVVAIYRAIGRVCAYCHEYFPLSDIEPDHVIALSVGGSNSITNVAPACKLCNSDKRELSMADWATCRDRRGLEPRTLHPLVSHLTLAML